MEALKPPPARSVPAGQGQSRFRTTISTSSLFKSKSGPMTTFNKNCELFVSLNTKVRKRHRRFPSQRRRNNFKYLIVVHFDGRVSR